MNPSLADKVWLAQLSQDSDIDRLFDYVDDLLVAKSYDRVDALLEAVPVEQFSPEMLVGWLTITGKGWIRLSNQLAGSSGSVELPHRADFVRRVEAHLRATLNDDARVTNLLKGIN